MGEQARETDIRNRLKSPLLIWIFASLIGYLIVLPMTFVAYNPTLSFAIPATYISTFVFAYIIATFGRGTVEAKDAISATIAYAAVLVVFVGAIMGSSLAATSTN